MPPYERIQPYRRRGRWRRWFSAALPWLFVACVAATTMLPVRDWVRRTLPNSVDSQAARDAEMVWKRAGSSDMRHPVEVIRTIDGDTFEARVHLGPGLDPTTHVRLRGIDAPELKASCPQELQMAEAATDALRALLRRRRRHDLQYRTGQICRAASSPTLRRGAAEMFRQRCLPRVMPEATAAVTAAAGARTPAKQCPNKKAAQSRGFSHSVRSVDQRVTVTVVPTGTR